MSINLQKTQPEAIQPILLSASKSISNRILIMQALAQQEFSIHNISNADDSNLMHSLLISNSSELNAGMAGTVFRFMTAYLAIQKGRQTILTGSSRMLERPIADLVIALRSLGAEIEYLQKDGFPPLKIKGKSLKDMSIKLDASKSSQYVTALLLIAPYLEEGIEIELIETTSLPYIEMTIELMQMAGVEVELKSNTIKVKSGEYHINEEYIVEADWSSAAFFYEAFAISDIPYITISELKENSIQGDKRCAELFELLGVKTSYKKEGLHLTRITIQQSEVSVDLKDQPDLILPFAVAASFLLKRVKIQGIETLRLKESDRVLALKKELAKIADFEFEETEKQLSIRKVGENLNSNVAIRTYNDHRMAMCMSPLVLLTGRLEIDEPEVVIKSFPNFWEEIAKMGVVIV